MTVRKIAISVPEEVLRQVDKLAKRTRTTRSGLITQILKKVSKAQTEAELTAQIDRAFEDISVQEEQSATSRVFLRAAEGNSDDDQW